MTLEIMNLIEFNPLKTSPEDWTKYHVFRRQRHMETYPEDPMNHDETSEKTLKLQYQHSDLKVWLFGIYPNSEQERMIGFLFYGVFKESSASYKGNEKIIQYEIDLLQEYRRQGIGTNVLEKVLKFAKINKKSLLIAGTNESDGRAFLKALGAQEALASRENRLNLNEVDWNEMQNWVKEGRNKSPLSEMKFYYSIPEEIIDDYSKFYTEVLNQAPLDDLDVKDIIFTPELIRRNEKMREETGRTWLTAITFEDDGEISGMTEMIYTPDRESMISQDLTGVKEKFRGRSLGKWLKAAMLLRIHDEMPKVKTIVTGNANSNAPMLAINQQIGFKLYKEQYHTQLQLVDLENYLSTKKD